MPKLLGFSPDDSILRPPINEIYVLSFWLWAGSNPMLRVRTSADGVIPEVFVDYDVFGDSNGRPIADPRWNLLELTNTEFLYSPAGCQIFYCGISK